MANCRYCGLRNAIRHHRCIHCGTPFGACSPTVLSSWESPGDSSADVRRRIAILQRRHSELMHGRVRVFTIPSRVEDNPVQVGLILQRDACLSASRR